MTPLHTWSTVYILSTVKADMLRFIKWFKKRSPKSRKYTLMIIDLGLSIVSDDPQVGWYEIIFVHKTFRRYIAIMISNTDNAFLNTIYFFETIYLSPTYLTEQQNRCFKTVNCKQANRLCLVFLMVHVL